MMEHLKDEVMSVLGDHSVDELLIVDTGDGPHIFIGRPPTAMVLIESESLNESAVKFLVASGVPLLAAFPEGSFAPAVAVVVAGDET